MRDTARALTPLRLMSPVGHRLCRTESGRLGGVRGAKSVHLAIGFAAFLGACASAPPTEAELAYVSSMSATVEMATTPAEEEALHRAATLPVGEPTTVDGGTVVAGPIYAAGSGRRCRPLTVGSRNRLACEALGAEGWVYVPDVFSPSEANEGGESPTAPSPEPAEADFREGDAS